MTRMCSGDTTPASAAAGSELEVTMARSLPDGPEPDLEASIFGAKPEAEEDQVARTGNRWTGARQATGSLHRQQLKISGPGLHTHQHGFTNVQKNNHSHLITQGPRTA